MIKITNKTGIGNDTKVFNVDEEGNETEINDVLSIEIRRITREDFITAKLEIQMSLLDILVEEEKEIENDKNSK